MIRFYLTTLRWKNPKNSNIHIVAVFIEFKNSQVYLDANHFPFSGNLSGLSITPQVVQRMMQSIDRETAQCRTRDENMRELYRLTKLTDMLDQLRNIALNTNTKKRIADLISVIQDKQICLI